MKLTLLATALVLASPALGQIPSTRALISESASIQLPGLPAKGVLTKQGYGRQFTPVGTTFPYDFDRGVEHRRIEWDDERRAYRGIFDAGWARALPLGPRRTLFEAEDEESPGRTELWIGEWHGSSLHFYSSSLGPDSILARELRSHGARVTGGAVDGSRGAVLDALRGARLTKEMLRHRLRRPNSDELARIWNWFEIERWYVSQKARLDDVGRNLSRLQRLGDQHLAYTVANEAHYPALASLSRSDLDQYSYARLSKWELERLASRAKRLVDTLGDRIDTRMAWLASKIEVVEHVKVSDEWGMRHSPGPGALLRFHAIVRRPDGTLLDDTRNAGEAPPRPILGDMPEGVQFGLRTMAYDDTLTLRIPPQLAFGSQIGEIVVELKIVAGVYNPFERPPVEELLDFTVAPVDAETAASGLRHRDLVVGAGAEVEVGQTVEVRTSAWNLFHDELDVNRSLSGVIGSEAFLPGVNEGLATMRVGGRRVLFVPDHLADQDPARRGMAQCVVVELVAAHP